MKIILVVLLFSLTFGLLSFPTTTKADVLPCTGEKTGLPGECRNFPAGCSDGQFDGFADCPGTNWPPQCCVQCGLEYQICCPNPISPPRRCKSTGERRLSCNAENICVEGDWDTESCLIVVMEEPLIVGQRVSAAIYYAVPNERYFVTTSGNTHCHLYYLDSSNPQSLLLIDADDDGMGFFQIDCSSVPPGGYIKITAGMFDYFDVTCERYIVVLEEELPTDVFGCYWSDYRELCIVGLNTCEGYQTPDSSLCYALSEDECDNNIRFPCVDRDLGECTGAATGLPGFCFSLLTLDCSPNPPWWPDGKGGCGFLQNCCVQSGERPDRHSPWPPTPPAAVFCDADGNPTDEPGDNPRLYTAIGCIPIGSNTEFAGFFLGWSLGIGGGIAFILIVYAGFLIITSAGNPQRLQAGKELLTAAATGIILLVFSVFLLRLFGIDIFRIPGFG